MNDILVAGAGHGGLAAAILLAKHGYDVTVYEKEREDALGHDWEDRFSFGVLDDLLTGGAEAIPQESWRVRGDSVFVSPSKRKKIPIHFDETNAQKIMWRKALLGALISEAKNAGVKFRFETEVLAPLTNGRRVTGVRTADGPVYAGFTIDAAGAFSPVRSGLPKYFHIEKEPKYGDVFYAYRAYFDKTHDVTPKEPFEVSLYHEGEKGLSWLCTNQDTVDILIGRIDKLTDQKIAEMLDIYRKEHPWTGTNVVNGGSRAIIPVRRPLTLMVADGYAAVGDAAFMTTPMNGMGIDLSLNAGKLLAKTVIESKEPFSVKSLWNYNHEFHALYGGEASKNEGLKNALLKLPAEGVDFLFENDVIQGSDLAGGGKNINVTALLGKLRRGMRNPTYFLTIVGGLMNGSKVMKTYQNAPKTYDLPAIQKWSKEIAALDITQ
ncbi:MAG: NAD(P)/FAD-dependent oxidoreductase [Clostridia bacterium]|nr:NAD(P)/FAD-dependent oxidoreductase [Clostridia bacterium]